MFVFTAVFLVGAACVITNSLTAGNIVGPISHQ